MGWGSFLSATAAAASSVAKHLSKRNKRSSSSRSSSSSSSRSSSSRNSSSSNHRYNPNMDYAAEIAKEKNEARKQQLIRERQYKIDDMKSQGTWNNNWKDNSIYDYAQKAKKAQEEQRKKAQEEAQKQKYISGRQNEVQSKQANGTWGGGGWTDNNHSQKTSSSFLSNSKNIGNGIGGMMKGMLDQSTSKTTGRTTESQRVYDMIQKMKDNSSKWGGANPVERKTLAKTNENMAKVLGYLYGMNVTKDQDGNWYYSDPDETGEYQKLYDTVYLPKEQESILPEEPQEEMMPPEYIVPPQMEYMEPEMINNQMDEIAQLQAQARQDQVNQIINNLNSQKQDVNTGFDDIAKQAYIARRQAEMNMPQQLAAMGNSGGMAETTALGLQTNYENNLNSNEVARMRQLGQIDNSITNAQLTADSDIAGYQAQANQAALQAYMNQMAQKNSYNQWLASFQAQQQENAWSRQMQEKLSAKQAAEQAYNRQFQEMTYVDQMAQQAYQNTIAEKMQAIQLALQTGDYGVLKNYGIDTTYLTDQQKYGLAMQELERAQAQANLQNTQATIQKKTNSIGRSRGGGHSGVSRNTGYSKDVGMEVPVVPSAPPLQMTDFITDGTLLQDMALNGSLNEKQYNTLRNAIYQARGY